MKSSFFRSFLIPALLLVFACSSVDTSSQPVRPDIVLIILDAVNADHLGCYGYHRGTSPAIDSLAASGMRFANCQAQAPWTLPGVTSILTGLTERSHRCNRYDDITFSLASQIPTIASILCENGYSTASYVNHDAMGEALGLNRGYETFWFGRMDIDNAEATIDSVIQYIKDYDHDDPYFITVHLFDPHLPYDPPAPFNTIYAPEGSKAGTDWPDSVFCGDSTTIFHMQAMYDSELNWTDYQINRLFQYLRSDGLADRTLIILTSDHGEEFMEHGETGHSRNLYQQVLHIPLILSGPGIPSDSISYMNSGQFDILPTILDYLDITSLSHIEGVSLLGDVSEDRIIPSSGVLGRRESIACLRSFTKVIWYPLLSSTETYNLHSDPEEITSLSPDSSLLVEVMGYRVWPPLYEPLNSGNLNHDQDFLRDLGYIR